MHGFETVEHELEARRAQLEQELAAVRGRMDEIQADLERVHDAMAALTGTKKKSKAKARAKKPVPAIGELHEHIAHVRQHNPYANAAELEKAVRARVQEHGGSLAGFKALFAEALVSSPGHQGAGASSHGLALHHPSHQHGVASSDVHGGAHDEHAG
jgi:hypothetical protein